MRVTIGERLGVTFRTPIRGTSPPTVQPSSDEAIPSWVEPENVIRLSHAPSARTVPAQVIDWDDDDTEVDLGPPRVTGHMEWVHKSVPVLVIHGRGEIPPEEYAAMRRR